MSEMKCGRFGRDKACRTMCAFEGEEKECYRFEPPGRLRVIYVKPEHLYHHPDNPRKDVGDVSELAASIRNEGIRQPLTVIPYVDEDGDEVMSQYTVVIGHRRLEAARVAGLEEVPCIVACMDRAEQLATMLTENMQRVDLTPVEQADGFQLMLELPGATVAKVAERTGFSETTVRRRLKLRELDREALLEAESRGGTLADYEKLQEVKDPERRKKVLDTIGTAEFARTLRTEKEAEQRLVHKERLIRELEEMGVKQISVAERAARNDIGVAQTAYGWEWRADRRWEPLAKNTEHVFTAGEGDAIRVYRVLVRKTSTPSLTEELKGPTKEERIRKLRQEAGGKLDEVCAVLRDQDQDFLDLRQNWLAEFGQFERFREEIMGLAVRALLWNADYDMDELAQWLGIELDDDDELDPKALDTLLWKCPEKVLLYTAYLALDDGNRGYVDHHGYNVALERRVPKRWKDEQLDLVYDYLERLGYERCRDELDSARGETQELLEAQRIVHEYTVKIQEVEKEK